MPTCRLLICSMEFMDVLLCRLAASTLAVLRRPLCRLFFGTRGTFCGKLRGSVDSFRELNSAASTVCWTGCPGPLAAQRGKGW
jgi:hypothetical protein